MVLKDSALRALKPAEKTYRKSHGGGLYVEVTPKGLKLWRFAYRYGDKQKTLSFGINWHVADMSRTGKRFCF
jgi:hypothetical protein